MIITQTPLRISLAGGGTDFRGFYEQEDGFVVSSAIDKYLFVIVKERFDDRIYINYMKKEIVDYVDEIQHELVREAMKITGVERGVEITMLADVPSGGSGLGSSSSITVGLLNALYMYQGEQVTAEQLAREACEIEIERCGKPIGVQDQYIAAYGNLRSFRFRASGQVEVERIPIGDADKRVLGSNLQLFFTDKTRQADVILAEQKSRIADRMGALRKLKQYAIEAKGAIGEGRFDEVGRILKESWEFKKQMAGKITNREIDAMYDKAMSAGALGGKISGAGGGGFLLVYAQREWQNAVREALSDYRELPFFLENDGSKVIFNARRYSAK